MKCVCPSGGDRTCPDDCLLAVWHGLPEDDRPARRKPIAEQLYKQGYTQDQIAMQLGVSRQTIQLDLANLPIVGKSKRAKTTRNPKGAGRPKGSKKRGGPQPQRRKNDPAKEDAAAALVLDQKKTYDQAAKAVGLNSVQVVKTAVAREEGRREERARKVGTGTVVDLNEHRVVAMFDNGSICKYADKWAKGKTEKERIRAAYKLFVSLLGHSRNAILKLGDVVKLEKEQLRIFMEDGTAFEMNMKL